MDVAAGGPLCGVDVEVAASDTSAGDDCVVEKFTARVVLCTT